MEEKEIKVVKSYSLPPSHVEWLRQRAADETKDSPSTISASDVLTRIIEKEIAQSEKTPRRRNRNATPIAA